MANWLTYVVQQQISDTDEVLDLGCGKGAVTNDLKCKKLTGIEIFKPWLEEYRGEKVFGDITKIEFPESSYDVILALDVLEHISLKEAKKLIDKMEKWAKKKIIIYTPAEFKLQSTLNNLYNQHRSLIPKDYLEKKGFKTKIIPPDMNLLAIKTMAKNGEV